MSKNLLKITYQSGLSRSVLRLYQCHPLAFSSVYIFRLLLLCDFLIEFKDLMEQHISIS